MQAVRRSDRLRNIGILRRPQLPARGTASLPNLINMGGGQYNIDNGNVQINVDLGDAIPIEQGQGDGEDLFHEELFLGDENILFMLLANPVVKALTVFVVILFTVLLADSFTSLLFGEVELLRTPINSISSNYNFDESYSSPYHVLKQNNMEKNVKILKNKLRKLSRGIQVFKELRNNITTKIKNEALLECSKEIEEALKLYDADKLGMIDYALESAGGYITSIPDTIPFPSHFSYEILGLININYPSNPRLLIQPENLPGQCFAFQGHTGKIRIRLSHKIKITAVTIEHTHQNLIEDMNSAPKDFKVYGLKTADSKTGEKLGMFTYNLDKGPIQTFYMEQQDNLKGYRYVELHILTNHGKSDYTCVYRFRVHGFKITGSK